MPNHFYGQMDSYKLGVGQVVFLWTNMDTQKKAEFEALYKRYLAWKESQTGQTSGYEYKRSFVALMEEFNQELFELSVQNPEAKKK